MLTDPWFQSWHPPGGLVADQHPFHGPVHMSNFSDFNNFGGYQFTQTTRTQARPDTLLPYLLSLSVIRPRLETKPIRQQVHPRPRSESNIRQRLPPTRHQSQTFRKSSILEQNIPLEKTGVDVHGDRIFVSMPKWKTGVPATLAVLPRVPRELSPKLVPYPNWQWHQTGK
ncbi:unnamed protein product [Phaedon cochleariae]|uniref:Uncharacterized protein n=1 Tax=Phaedon cochleariae TaxID=80249 RepID=A0A9N9S7X4_PHACE|nr:unnamed protein product [Phaedon cochleariae]